MLLLLSPRRTALAALVLPVFLGLTASGCTLLGLGAAAVGGCALLDRNHDTVVTQDELSAGLFTAWDTNDDGRLSPAEYDAGVGSRAAFADWSGAYSDWDTNDDNQLTEAEFNAGVTARGGTAGWVDAGCDDLGL